MTTINTTPLPFNVTPVQPSLKDLLNQVKTELLINLNCHHLGTIESFDSQKQTATVTLNYQKTFFNLNATSQQYQSTLVAYPTLVDCPVVILSGNMTSLTFPIAKGDECLVLFNDRDIDNWFAGSITAGVATPRLHSFSDGLVIVGLNSLPNVLGNYDTTRVLMRGGEIANSITAVGVNPSNSKVLITNTYPANSTTLNTLLSQLISNIKDLVTAVNAITVTTPINVPSTPFIGSATSGTPNNSTQISNVTTELTNTTNAIAALLE